MSIHPHPGKDPLTPPPPRPWGRVAPEKEKSTSVRFVLPDRVVSFPVAEIKRWEHIAGNPETLLILAGREQVMVEGQHLTEVRVALDEVRLCELRMCVEKPMVRTGPTVRRITIEPA